MITFPIFLWLACGLVAWLVALHKLYNVFPKTPIPYRVRPLRVLVGCLASGPFGLIYWTAL